MYAHIVSMNDTRKAPSAGSALSTSASERPRSSASAVSLSTSVPPGAAPAPPRCSETGTTSAEGNVGGAVQDEKRDSESEQTSPTKHECVLHLSRHAAPPCKHGPRTPQRPCSATPQRSRRL